MSKTFEVEVKLHKENRAYVSVNGLRVGYLHIRDIPREVERFDNVTQSFKPKRIKFQQVMFRAPNSSFAIKIATYEEGKMLEDYFEEPKLFAEAVRHFVMSQMPYGSHTYRTNTLSNVGGKLPAFALPPPMEAEDAYGALPEDEEELLDDDGDDMPLVVIPEDMTEEERFAIEIERDIRHAHKFT